MKTSSTKIRLAFLATLALPLSIWAQPAENYDIYIFNVKTKAVSQLTHIEGAGEFNPSFSPSGAFVVHDVFVPSSSTQDLYVTSTHTGESKPLKGGDGGNDASWSPLEFLIAFDRAPVGDFSIYTTCFFGPWLPGGGRKLIRENALDPDWSPWGNRIVFSDITDGSIKTIRLFDKRETTVALFGSNPVWSPDGNYIAYSNENNIFIARVNFNGEPIGFPTQITFDDPSNTYNFGSTWSADSRHIAFLSNRETTNFDFDIWSVSINNGAIKRLTGSLNNGDYDPSFSKNGKLLAYAGFTDAVFTATASLKLEQNFPNPFTKSTTIPFEITDQSQVEITIMDSSGKPIRTLAHDNLEQGAHSVTWDRTSDDGGTVPKGYYYYTLKTQSGVQVKRLLITD